MSNPKPPFAKLQDAYTTRLIPGTDLVTGTRVTVVNCINQGTKRNPEWRLFVSPAAWVNPDDLSATPIQF